jgi:hypothetical protein
MTSTLGSIEESLSGRQRTKAQSGDEQVDRTATALSLTKKWLNGLLPQGHP